MSHWFSMLGEPLDVAQQRQVRDYLAGLNLARDFPVASVSDWTAAHAAVADPEWDQRWWHAEQHERDRLLRKAGENLGEPALRRALSTSLDSADKVYEAAAEAAQSGCSDVALVRAAAGALSQALYLAELSRIAGEGELHPFSIKKALFAGGHWPLGIVQGTYYVF